MSRLKEDLFRKLVRELIKQELDEANTTASVGGQYSTPHSFKGSNKKGKKKEKAGYSGGHSDPTIGTDNFNADDPKLRKESVNEGQKKFANKIVDKFDQAYLKFSREVRDVIKMMDRSTGDKTDGKIIDKAYSKGLIPLDKLMKSWNRGQQSNPKIDEYSGMSKWQRDRLDQRSKEKGKKPKKVSKALKKKQDAWAKKYYTKGGGINIAKWKKDGSPRFPKESVNEAVSPKGWNMSKKYISFIDREVKKLKKYHMQQNEEDFLEVANYIELQLKQMKKDLNESVNERTDSQAKKNLMRALKNSKVADVFSYDNNQIAIEMTNGDDYIVGNIQSYNPNESINEANIKDIEKVLKTRSAKKIDGMYMDMTTANAIMTVYKALNTSNRKKFEKLPLKKMVDVTWKLVK